MVKNIIAGIRGHFYLVLLILILHLCQPLPVQCGSGVVGIYGAGLFSSPTIKPDEEVIFFPTSASYDHDLNQWTVPVHGWVFEPEEDSAWRSYAIKVLLEVLELGSIPVDNPIFKKRVRMFLVDNERGKSPQIRIGQSRYIVGRTEPNGHFTSFISLTADQAKRNEVHPWVHFALDQNLPDRRVFEGCVQLVGDQGLSIISDIDDTIKISHVADKKALLANTFLRPFRAVPGMADLYIRWEKSNAVFHYVSSSPWQLYPALAEFIEQHQFPKGSFHLKCFRLKDSSFLSLFTKDDQYKLSNISILLQRFPKREFILVGDAGERDPEIYGEIARQFPTQVKHIFIRRLRSELTSPDRYQTAFRNVDADRWTLFSDPKALMGP